MQKSGLQSHVEHGVFHTPNFDNGSSNGNQMFDPRKGCRIAITAQINYPDSNARVEPYLKDNRYSAVLGPAGIKTLCLAATE